MQGFNLEKGSVDALGWAKSGTRSFAPVAEPNKVLLESGGFPQTEAEATQSYRAQLSCMRLEDPRQESLGPDCWAACCSVALRPRVGKTQMGHHSS